MRRGDNILALALLATLLATLLAGCDIGQSGPQLLLDAQQVLRMQDDVVGNPGVTLPLDPALGIDRDLSTVQYLTLLYSGLVTYDQSLHPQLADADHVTISPDGLTYTFHLRSDLRWPDHTSITSADFAYSINRALDPCLFVHFAPVPPTGTPAHFAYYLYDLKDARAFSQQQCRPDGTILNGPGTTGPVRTTLIGDAIQTPDPATIVLTLDHPDGAFLSQLAFPVASVVDLRLTERYGNAWTEHLADNGGQGTSGMYVVKSFGWTPARQSPFTLALVRSVTYWGQKPRLRELDLTIADKVQTGQNPYLDGTIDVFAPSPLSPFGNSPDPGDPGFHYSVAPMLDILTLNWQQPPFDDLRVRQAFALATDKTQAVRFALYQTYGAPLIPTAHLIPDGTSGYNPSLTAPLGVSSPSGDATRARSLWLSYVADKCGGDATRCAPINIGDGCGPTFNQSEADALIPLWRAALPGIQISYGQRDGCLVPMGNPCVWQMTILSWGADFPDPEDWLAPQFEPGYAGGFAPGELTCVNDTAAVPLLHRADAMPDSSARTQLYQRAEQVLVNDVAAIPLYQRQMKWEVRPYVLNYDPHSWYWVVPAQWAAIAIAKH